MRFFKRRKKKEVMVDQVPLSVLIRQVIYDSMLMPPEGIADLMGLPPISEEVSEMEERASQARLQRLGTLLPFIDAHADISARVATSAYVLDDEDDNEMLDEVTIDKLTELFRLVALASSVSCVSTLFSLGLVHSSVVEDFDER